MTMKKGPSPAIFSTLSSAGVLGSVTLSAGTSTAILTLPALFTSTVLAPLTMAGSALTSALGSIGLALSAPLTASFAPALTPGLDFGAGLTRGIQDALTGGDLLTELLSVLGSAGTTATVVAPTTAPCPFC